MSTILVNTLTGTSTAGSILVTGEGNSTTTNLQPGLVKQWGRINQDTPEILGSFNSSSLTDVGTGTHRFVFTNNMSNANYACSGMAQAEAVVHRPREALPFAAALDPELDRFNNDCRSEGRGHQS